MLRLYWKEIKRTHLEAHFCSRFLPNKAAPQVNWRMQRNLGYAMCFPQKCTSTVYCGKKKKSLLVLVVYSKVKVWGYSEKSGDYVSGLLQLELSCIELNFIPVNSLVPLDWVWLAKGTPSPSPIDLRGNLTVDSSCPYAIWEGSLFWLLSLDSQSRRVHWLHRASKEKRRLKRTSKKFKRLHEKEYWQTTWPDSVIVFWGKWNL